MKEEVAIRYIPQRVSERGFSKHRLVYQDLNFSPGQYLKMAAFNEIWFLLDAEEGILIRSDFGVYNYGDRELNENIHEHGDDIFIKNTSNQIRKVRFIQVILID